MRVSSMMDPNLLRRYNDTQKAEILRVYDEVKWYLGEKLHRDPSKSPDDLKVVNNLLAEIILAGFGQYLATLETQLTIRQRLEESTPFSFHSASLETASQVTSIFYKLN